MPTLRSFRPPVTLMLVFVAFALVALAQPAQANPRYAAIVVDADTGVVLHARNADTLRYPASLTKMMTLFMAFEALRDGRLAGDQRLPVSRHAASMIPSKLGLAPGQSITVDDAIKALITRSANDIAVAVAEAIGGTESEFAVMMTQRARELGMSNTTFRNASGLPDSRQQSTARDMATLSLALLRDFPDRYHLFNTREFRYGGTVHRNHNRLLASYNGLDGIKTGYIRASGFNIAASAVRDGRRLIAVVFGGRTAQTRNDHTADLLDRVFAQVRPPRGIQVVGPPVRRPLPAAYAERQMPAVTEGRERVEIEAARLPDPATAEALAAEAPEAGPPVEQGSSDLAGIDARTGFGIQVGAFSDPAAAERTASWAYDRLGPLVASGRIDVDSVERYGSRLFRSRLVGIGEDGASDACRRLVADGHACHVITAEPPNRSAEALPRVMPGAALGVVY